MAVMLGALTVTMFVAEASSAQVILLYNNPSRGRGFGVPVGGYNPYYYSFGYTSYGYTPYGYGYGAYPGYRMGIYYASTSNYRPSTYTPTPATSRISPASTVAVNTSVRPASYESYYPANPVTSQTALIEVRVPAEAEVWFDGEKSIQTGLERSFRSPALQPDTIYSYEVKARWTENGKPVEKMRKVRIMKGEQIRITFLNPES